MQNASIFAKMSMVMQHPFTCIVSGPTGCGKTQFTFKLISNCDKMIYPQPEEIIWSYGVYQPAFRKFPNIKFTEGIPDGEQFDGSRRVLLVIDDLMHETNEKVSQIFTRGSHHKNISVIYLTQNLFHTSKHNRTMSLNSHYLVLFKNPRDRGQIAHLARQMYPHNSKYLEESFRDATKDPYQYLFVDLKANTEEDMRLRSNVFPDDAPHHFVYVPRN